MSRLVKPIEITAEAVPTTYSQYDFVDLVARLIKRGEAVRGLVAVPPANELDLPIHKNEPPEKAA